MTSDVARLAAVRAALGLVPATGVIGLGSGRAVFALVDAIARRPGGAQSLRCAVASSRTAELAADAGIAVVDLNTIEHLDVAFDGADEIGPDLSLIKGGGAALLREKLVFGAARRVVILAEAEKQVDRLGISRKLPVEVVRFGWQHTLERLTVLSSDIELRRDENGQPVVTDEGHHLLDIVLPPGDLEALAGKLKSILGVVDHGLFLGMADEVILGHEDGSTTTLQQSRSERLP